MTEFMEEVVDIVNRIFGNYITWLRTAPSELHVETARKQMDGILNFILDETSPMKIAKMQLLAELELKK